MANDVESAETVCTRRAFTVICLDDPARSIEVPDRRLAIFVRVGLDVLWVAKTAVVVLPPQARTDSDTLQLWLTRAATASKLEDVFGDS